MKQWKTGRKLLGILVVILLCQPAFVLAANTLVHYDSFFCRYFNVVLIPLGGCSVSLPVAPQTVVPVVPVEVKRGAAVPPPTPTVTVPVKTVVVQTAPTVAVRTESPSSVSENVRDIVARALDPYAELSFLQQQFIIASNRAADTRVDILRTLVRKQSDSDSDHVSEVLQDVQESVTNLQMGTSDFTAVTVVGTSSFRGPVADSAGSVGTAGTILQSTGSGVVWVATSSLGIVGGGGATASGTVTAVALSAPAGFSVSGSPITSSGTLAFSYAAGYEALRSASSSNWNSFYTTPSSRITAGAGLSWSANTLALVTSGDWLGTFAGQSAPYYLSRANQTGTQATSTIAGVFDVTQGGTGANTATGARTNLGATTFGANAFTMVNPDAVSFLRVNADNSLSALDAGSFLAAIGAGAGSGTVSSVGLSAPTGFTVSGSPVTGAGTLAFSFASGYEALRSASSSNWNSFYTTPSSRITAGSGLGWSGTTLSLDASGDWTGTFDGREGAAYLDRSQHTGTQATSTITGVFDAVQGGTGLAIVNVNQLLIGGAGNVWTQIATSALGFSSAFTNSASLAALLSDETGTGTAVFSSSPTFITQLTSPKIVGGTAVSSSLILQSTSGAGSSDSIRFLVGNNGATEAARVFSSGNIGIGLAVDGGAKVTVHSGAASSTMVLINTTSNPRIIFSNSATTNFSSIGQLSNGLSLSGGGDPTTNPNLYISDPGNVGIGTTSPSALFSVGATATLQFLVSNAGVISDGTWNGDTLMPTYGGTGLTSYATGDLIFGGAVVNTLSKRAVGSTGDILSVVGGLPSWVATSSLGFSSGVTGIGPAGSIQTGPTITFSTSTSAGPSGLTAGLLITTTSNNIVYQPTLTGTLNNAGLTNSTVTLATGSTGSDISWSTGSVALGATATLNIPSSSAANRGLLTSADWTTFTGKISSTSLDTSLKLAALLSDETGSAGGGVAVFSQSPTLSGTVLADTINVSSALSADTINVTNARNGYAIGGSRILYASSTNVSTMVGIQSGININGTGIANTAVGHSALSQATSSDYNTAIGYAALNLNTAGSNNTAVGAGALQFNTFGSNNSAYGYNALFNNTFGSSNTAIGYTALNANTTGIDNTAIGRSALFSSSVGSENTALGLQAGYDVNATTTDDGANTFVGFNTGRGITTGINNTIIGAKVTGLAAGLSNTIILADGSGNKRIVVTSAGNVGMGSTTPGYGLSVVGTSRFTGASLFDGTINNQTISSAASFTGTLAVAGTAFFATTTISSSTITTLTLANALLPTSGGTGLSTYASGDLLYASAANTLAKRAIGTAGDVLSVIAGVPTWSATSTLGFAPAFSTSAQLAGLLSDETGTGNVVYSDTAVLTGTTTVTNMSMSGRLTLSALSASRALFLDGAKGVTTSGTSLALSSALSDETGTGAAVFAVAPSFTGTTTFATTTMGSSTIGTLNLGAALAVTSGGTGAATLTGLLQGNGTGAFTTISNSATVGQTLRVTGASTYAWGATDLANANAITGTLSTANGGLGRSGFGGTNTILYSSAANVLATSSTFVFTGTNLGVGSTTPGYGLSVAGTARITGDTNVDGVFTVGTNAPELITASAGDLVVGSTAFGFQYDASAGNLYSRGAANNATGLQFIVQKSRGTDALAPTVVTSGDAIFILRGMALSATTTTTFSESARITLGTEGTIGNGIVPGILRFHTANALGILTERFTIDSDGMSTFIASSTAGNGQLALRSFRAALVADSLLGGFNFLSADTNLGTEGSTTAAIRAYASQTHSSTALGSYLSFFTTPNNTVTPTESMRIDGVGNVAIGTTSANATLTVQGDINISDSTQGYEIGGSRVLYASSTNRATLVGIGAGAANAAALFNTAIGYQALNIASSTENTAVGYYALKTAAGGSNTGVGAGSLGNAKGSSNSAFGANAFANLTTGDGNIAIGNRAGSGLAAAVQSIFIGTDMAETSLGGLGNIIIGFDAAKYLSNATTSGYNTIIGSNNVLGLTSGVNNTIIGANVTELSAGMSNNIIIADGAGNQRINIGSTGNMGIGDTTPTEATLVVGASGAGDIYMTPTASTTANKALCWDASGASLIYDCGAAPTADYAEAYAVTPDVVGFGDIVMTTSEMVVQTDGQKSPRLTKATVGGTVIGITSNNYGDFTSTGHGAFASTTVKPVALNGRVPVRINLEGGPIAIGDNVTISSVAGVGKKATDSGEVVVGVALQSYTASSQSGTVLVFVTNKQHQTLADQVRAKLFSVDLDASSTVFASLENNTTDTIWNRLTTLAKGFVDGVLSVTGIKTREVCLSDAGGETCIDRSTLNTLLQQNTSSAPEPTPAPEEPPATTTSPEVIPDETSDSDTETTPEVEEPVSTPDAPAPGPPLPE